MSEAMGTSIPEDSCNLVARVPSLQERIFAVVPLFSTITFGEIHRCLPQIGSAAIEYALRGMLNTGALVRDANAFKRGRSRLVGLTPESPNADRARALFDPPQQCATSAGPPTGPVFLAVSTGASPPVDSTHFHTPESPPRQGLSFSETMASAAREKGCGP